MARPSVGAASKKRFMAQSDKDIQVKERKSIWELAAESGSVILIVMR